MNGQHKLSMASELEFPNISLFIRLYTLSARVVGHMKTHHGKHEAIHKCDWAVPAPGSSRRPQKADLHTLLP